MNREVGVNYKTLRINFKRAQDALIEISHNTKRPLPDWATQRAWIAVALKRCHATHPDFTLTKLERDFALEDVLYEALEEQMGVRK